MTSERVPDGPGCHFDSTTRDEVARMSIFEGVNGQLGC